MSASTVPTLQSQAATQASLYNAQMQTFINALNGASQSNITSVGSANTQGITNLANQLAPLSTFVSTLSTTELLSALNELLNEAQLDPPVPLTAPSLPTLTPPKAAAAIPGIAPPQFVAPSVPTYTDPVAPVVGANAFGGKLVPIVYPTDPVAPVIKLPTAPSFAQVVMPTITDIVLPTLTALPPQSILPDPTDLFKFNENAYSSLLLSTAEDKLLTDLQQGGYGIETADEQSLWQRARDRELKTGLDAASDTARAMSVRGFSLPAGTMLAQLAAVNQSVAEKVSSMSREIALKRADMYVENRKFTLNQAREYEQMELALFNAVMERGLNAAKATAQFGIEVYNASVEKFNALMRGFAIQVQAYGEEVRAAVAEMELQRLKLDVVRTEVEVEKAEVQLYAEQVQAQNVIVSMYRTSISAVEGLANVERLKLDTFRTQIEVYAEQLRAQTLQLQGYEAQTRGDMVKAEIYKTQVDAQLVQARFAEAQASIVESDTRVAVENLRAAIASIEASADVYKAQSQGVALSNEAQSRAFTSRTEVFKAIAGIYDSIGRIEIAGADLDLKAKYEGHQLGFDLTKAVLAGRTTAAGMAVEALSRGIQANLGQVLGIASALNTSTS